MTWYMFILKNHNHSKFNWHSSHQFTSVQSLSLVQLLWPQEPQYTRPPCLSPTPGVHSNPCPLSRWGHPTISSSVIPFSSCPQSFPGSGSFQMSQLFVIRWPKYWSCSFNISPSNEHPGLISFRVDWLDLLAVQGILESSPTPQFKSIYSSVLSFLYNPTLTSRRSNQSTLKEISPEYSLEGLVLKLKLQYFGHLMRRTNSLEKTLMLGKIESRRRRGRQDEMVGWHRWLNGHEFE